MCSSENICLFTSFIQLLIYMYVLITVVFFIHCMRKCQLIITHLKTNKQEVVTGFKKVLYTFLLCLIWPISIKQHDK